MGIKLINCKVI